MSEVAGKEIRVLHVDDDPDFVSVVAELLERDHDDISVVTATGAGEATDVLDETAIDCVVSDYEMPRTNGLELLEEIRSEYPDLPFILFTGKGSEELAGDAIAAGVTEYLQKSRTTGDYALLANRIRRAVSEKRAHDAREESERMFETLVENLPGMVYRCVNERGWPMEYISGGCEDLTGYTAEELESSEIVWGEEVLHDDDRERMWEDVQSAVSEGDPFEVTYRIRRRDGEVRWVWEQGRGVFENGELIALEGFITDITTRIHNEQDLEAEREFTESALNALDDMFFIIDPSDETLVHWNERMREVTGYTDDQIASMTAPDLVADEHVTRAREAMGEAVESGTTALVADIVTSDGERLSHEFRGTPLYDDGDLIGIGGVGRDITEQLERERELEQYRMLVENVGDPMYILDTEGQIRMVNSTLAEKLGYDREEIEGNLVTEFMPIEDVERGTEIILDLIENDEDTRRWEMEAIRSDGSRVLTENMTGVITDGDGEYSGSVGTIRDITQRKQRERELERYETIIEAVEDPVYALDEKGHFTFVNEAIEVMTGYAAEELLGTHIDHILPDEHVQEGRRLVRELLDDPDRRAARFEIDVQTADDRTVRSELHMALLPSENGQFRGTAGIVRDISERKERENRLEEFASVVSHDLRNPLNVIMGRIGLARETGDEEHFEDITEATERMQTLIDDLLTLARQGKTVSDVSPVDLWTVATNAWQSVDTGQATLDVDGDVTLNADQNRLRELLENLFRNSVEHGSTSPDSQTHQDAVEHSSTSSRPETDAKVDGGDSGVTVTVGGLDDSEGFFVADDGPGIPEKKRDTVFERGYSTAERGTGFGLSIVERISGAHGWDVELAESEDGGARFEFRV